MYREVIKAKKDERGWSNQQLAEAANLPPDTVNKILSGVTRNPNTDTLMRLAQALDCSLGDLVGELPSCTRQESGHESAMLGIIRESYEARIQDLMDTVRKHEQREAKMRREEYALLLAALALAVAAMLL